MRPAKQIVALQRASITARLKDVAPWSELLKWFNHEPGEWNALQKRYVAELDEKPESLEPILKAVKKGAVVLLFGAKDKEHNRQWH